MKYTNLIDFFHSMENAKQYARFFRHKDDIKPFDTWELRSMNTGISIEMCADLALKVHKWFEEYPDGAVDYVWLCNGIPV